MCDYSVGVYERGLAQGIEQGIAQGIAQGIESNLLENIKSVMDGLGMQLEKVLERVHFKFCVNSKN